MSPEIMHHPEKNAHEKAPVFHDLRVGRMIHRLHPVKTPATLLGMAGAVLVALPAAAPRMIGFASWMIANGLWIYQGMSTRDGYIAGLFGFYFLTTGFGIFNLI